MLKFNSSKASEGFTVLPEGKYECFVDGGQYKKASTGADMINWKLKIRNDVEQQGKGRVVFNNLVFNEKTEGMVHGFLKAIGTPEGKEFADYQEIINYATGKALLVNLKITQYQGKDQNNVSWVEPSAVGGGRVDNPFGEEVAATTTNYTRVDEDPFASTKGPIEASEDDLPF